jgi:hypothetical protein
MIFSQNQVAAADVYSSWFLHEKDTRNDVKDEHRQWFVESQLPQRASYPVMWYRCNLDPLLAPQFLVGQWESWTDWSQPEGTYFRIARRIMIADKIIPEKVGESIRQIAAGSEAKPVWFDHDPLFIRGISLEGPFTVIEGHHRASAVSLAVAEKKMPQSFAAFIGIGNL